MKQSYSGDQNIHVPTAAGEIFSVRRVYCVVGNYLDHAKELDIEVSAMAPGFFLKPTDAVICDRDVPYPPMTNDYQHEVELVVAIGKSGQDIPLHHARDHIFGFAVGLDMTRRDLQFTAREMRAPWDMAKGADFSAPCGQIVEAAECGDISASAICLKVNNVVRQSSSISKQTWNVDYIVHWLSKFVILEPGDLIFTGSPAGIGRVERGDILEASIGGLPTLKVQIV